MAEHADISGQARIPDQVATDEQAWAAVQARDRGFDGRFVTGVLTTRIYCRPSCAARHPRRENVRFFSDGAGARAQGLRACLRCRPDDLARDERAILAAITAIRDAQAAQSLAGLSLAKLSLADLAQAAGYSPTHFQRLFTRRTGLSPAAYARALRAERMTQTLSDARSVTQAIYDAGFSGPSRFYAASGGRLGMTASAWVDGGRGAVIHWAVVPTSMGLMLVAATDKGVCRLSFAEDGAALAARFPKATLCEGGDAFAALLAQVVAAVESPGTGDHIPIDVRGTVFQEAVWRALRSIPPGETRSYAAIAASIGHPRAVRAAGSANGANHVAVLIPCHRVIRADGNLGGYAYGLNIKRELLAREGVGP